MRQGRGKQGKDGWAGKDGHVGSQDLYGQTPRASVQGMCGAPGWGEGGPGTHSCPLGCTREDPGPRLGSNLTFSQGQGSLLATHIAQGKHGTVPLKEWPGLIQQDFPQPPHILLCCRGRWVH